MTEHLTNERLIDYLHHALAPDADAAVYAHLEQCAQCRSEYDAEASLSEALRAHARATERELPPTLKAGIWSEIRAERPNAWQRFVSGFRPAVALPVAAVLAVGIYFGVQSGGAGAPSIEAAYYLNDHAAMNSTTPFSDHNANPVQIQTSAAYTSQKPVAVQAMSYTADAGR